VAPPTVARHLGADRASARKLVTTIAQLVEKTGIDLCAFAKQHAAAFRNITPADFAPLALCVPPATLVCSSSAAPPTIARAISAPIERAIAALMTGHDNRAAR
jgi:hypothetical protein